MANIKLGGTIVASESSGAITIPAGTLGSGVTFPAGHVLQVVHHKWGDHDSSTSTTFDIPTNGSCAITPLDVNSHFLVTLYTQISGHAGSPAVKIAGTASATTTTVVGPIGNTLSSQTRATMGGHENTEMSSMYFAKHCSHSFIHDPALADLNTIYYNMLFATFNASTIYVNRAFGTDTGAYMVSTPSSFVIMEIARSS